MLYGSLPRIPPICEVLPHFHVMLAPSPWIALPNLTSVHLANPSALRYLLQAISPKLRLSMCPSCPTRNTSSSISMSASSEMFCHRIGVQEIVAGCMGVYWVRMLENIHLQVFLK